MRGGNLLHFLPVILFPALNTQYKACLKHPEPVFGYISWRFCYEVAQLLHGMVWGPWTLLIFLGTGLFLTVKCRFFSSEDFPSGGMPPPEASSGVKNNATNERTPDEGSPETISQFQSVCTALAATVGTGNIAGVATALTAGGPGALFWMWVSAFIGMITAYGGNLSGDPLPAPRTGRPLPCAAPSIWSTGLMSLLWPFSTAYSALCAPLAWGAWSRRTLLLLPCPLPLTFLSGSRWCASRSLQEPSSGEGSEHRKDSRASRPGSCCDLCPLFPHRDPFLSSCPSRRIKGYFRLCFSYTGCRRRQEAFSSAAACGTVLLEGYFPTRPALELWLCSMALRNTQHLKTGDVGHV